MRQPAHVYERRRLEQRGISQIEEKKESDTTRPILSVNAACFVVPLVACIAIFRNASFDTWAMTLLCSFALVTMLAAVFAILRPRRRTGYAILSMVCSLTLVLMIGLQTVSADYIKYVLIQAFQQ